MSKETLNLLLEALEYVLTPYGGTRAHVWDSDEARFVVQAYKVVEEALSKQEQGEPDDLMIAYMSGLYDGKKLAKQSTKCVEQSVSVGEPVAWMDRDGDLYKKLPSENWHPPHTPLYTTPQQRTWIELTDEERTQVMQSRTWMHTEGLCKAIEAKLKEKNI